MLTRACWRPAAAAVGRIASPLRSARILPRLQQVQQPPHQQQPHRLGQAQNGVRRLSCVTVSLDPSRGSTEELKLAAVDGVEEWLALGKRYSLADEAAVILVSRSLASWLDDDDFVARIISSTGISHHAGSRILSVVTAAVDEVPLYDRRLDLFGSSEGVSVLRGHSVRMFPRPGSLIGKKHDLIDAPSLQFIPPPCQHAGLLTVTVPLANTLFTTGKPHVLYESRWQLDDPAELPRKLGAFPKKTQTIGLTPKDMGFIDHSVSTARSYLVPVTAPRKITGGLGNILRQVEGDHLDPRPASEELEDVIPRLLEARRRALGDVEAQRHPSGPVNVWALLIPGPLDEQGPSFLKPLRVEDYQPDVEMMVAGRMARRLNTLLASGCELRKVLSGGGGWGEKKGLLSLDPQNQASQSDDQDFEAFMASFKGSGGPGGIAAPGSYVQFLVEPVLPSRGGWTPPSARKWNPADCPETLSTPTTVFGTPGVAARSSLAHSARAWPNLFGAISSEGVYYSGTGKPDGPAVRTKIDAPRSHLISSARFRPPPDQLLEAAPLVSDIPQIDRRDPRVSEHRGSTYRVLRGRGQKSW